MDKLDKRGVPTTDYALIHSLLCSIDMSLILLTQKGYFLILRFRCFILNLKLLVVPKQLSVLMKTYLLRKNQV